MSVHLLSFHNNTQKIPHVALVKILGVASILRFLHGNWPRSLHVNVAGTRFVLGTQILPNRSGTSLLHRIQMVQSKQCGQMRRMGH
jgi:hypothetical protein